MRGAVAIAVALIASCSAPVANATPSTASPSAPPPTNTASPRPTPTAPPAPPAPGPASAGAVPDAGVLFFSDYEGTTAPSSYRYDGASGALTKVDWPGSISRGVAYETASGIYLRGPNGRWDLLRWDGSRAGDQEFTACQQEPNFFASWCSVSATGVGAGYGSHVGPGPGPLTGPWCPPAWMRLPGTARSTSFPQELCVQWVQVSADGTQFVFGGLARDATPGVLIGDRCQPGYVTADGTSCYQQRLWTMPVGGAPRQLRLSPDVPGFVAETVSPDGRSATGVDPRGLVLVDLATGKTTSLGAAGPTVPRWSSSGGLAFVRGSGEESWIDKTVVVVAADGSTRTVTGGLPIGLAPAWDPAGRRLAWIASPGAAFPLADGSAQDYLAGKGVGDRRVLVSDLTSDPLTVGCGQNVPEGVRWSNDGTALLLLCRRPGARVDAYELWLHRLGGASVPIVRGITWGGVDAHGFAPDLFAGVAWQRASSR